MEERAAWSFGACTGGRDAEWDGGVMRYVEERSEVETEVAMDDLAVVGLRLARLYGRG